MNIEREHRYAKHIEVFIAFLALFLLGMGIYQITNGQTTGNTTGNVFMYNVPGSYDVPPVLNNYEIPPSTISPMTKDNVNFKNCAAFTKYHAFGDKGGDVVAIQMFLKEKGYYKGTISGVYGIATFKAVQAFQKDYSKEILNPWGIQEKATGRWYKSTTYKANKILGCPQPAVYLERVNKLLDY